jgi:carbon storage regulator
MEFRTMLILSRRESESVHLGDDIVLTIVRVSGEKVRIGIQAPSHIKVLRNELEVEDTSAVKPEGSVKPAVAGSRPTPITVRRAA